MSDATAQQLKRAEAALADRQKAADEAKDALVRLVAEGLPTRIDAIAKQTAQAQPEVTKTLGVDGVKQLRADLATKADELAAELIEDGVDKIDWPEETSEWSRTTARNVHSAFFHYFYGRRANGIAAVFKDHGYDVRDDNAQRSQGLVHPHSLYREDDMTVVAEAQNALGAARRDFANAKKADDADIVSGIWGDS